MKKTNSTTENPAAISTFVEFMTLFGTAQQALKNRMQDEAEQGLGPQHLRALCLCLDNPGGTQQELVQAMGRDKGQIARLTRELEERNFLLRTPDEHDKRLWRLSVTAEGKKKSQWFLAIEHGVAADLFAGLDKKELQHLEQFFRQLRERINATDLSETHSAHEKELERKIAP